MVDRPPHPLSVARSLTLPTIFLLRSPYLPPALSCLHGCAAWSEERRASTREIACEQASSGQHGESKMLDPLRRLGSSFSFSSLLPLLDESMLQSWQ